MRKRRSSGFRLPSGFWLRSLAGVAGCGCSAAAGAAMAFPGPAGESTAHYATEPSTGSMVLAALFVIAALRRGRSPRAWPSPSSRNPDLSHRSPNH